MSSKPTILLTNDDGYQAIGFYPLMRELSKDFQVIAVAPDSKKSWQGKAISCYQPLKVKEVQLEEFSVYAVNGTPADCVQLGLYDLSVKTPDFVVSGINIGMNAGHGRILSSGTAGAAIEAAINEVPALASSLHLTEQHDQAINYFDRKFYYVYDQAAIITAKLVRIAMQNKLPEDTDLLSVNIPFTATIDSPCEVTSIARDKYGPIFVKEGEEFVHMRRKDAKPVSTKNFPSGTDLHALDQEHISVTPVSLDLTSHSSKEKLQHFINQTW
jgi:5'-nucleotidase